MTRNGLLATTTNTGAQKNLKLSETDRKLLDKFANKGVIGDNDADILCAIETLHRCGGGYTVVSGGKVLDTVELPIMGMMSDIGFDTVQKTLQRMIAEVHDLNVSKELSPFILLSFLALTVIPELRITPRGLFDVTRMQFVEE